MSIGEIIAIVATAFLGLIGVIYGNIKAEINRVRNNCDEQHAINYEWQEKDTDFKVEVVDRLARLETLIRENGKNAV
jgi:hypothetical protein